MSKSNLDKLCSLRYNFLRNPQKQGLVAQLGAHRIRIAGVGSSNLLESTNKSPAHMGGAFIGISWRFEHLNATVRWTVARRVFTRRLLNLPNLFKAP